jgi:hypothetical protein
MRPPADYVALRDLKIPGSDYAYALRAGDELTEIARANSRWVVGVDVAPLRTDSMPRPADDAPRSAWQDYAVVQGVPYSEAVDLDAAELRERIETRSDDAPTAAGQVPEAGDRKAAWVDYATSEIVRESAGQVDEATARERAGSLTKADLVEVFSPDGDSQRRAELTAPPRTVEQVGPHGDLIVEREATVDTARHADATGSE